ncbi:MAG TPA: hypothetical protein VFF39_19320 [Verrucomicrobiae bacterium]|nr:hypothetical protein [Verrucomicrobiae bacterium]
MMHNRRGLLLLPFLSGILFAAEPFQLRIPDLSQAWFPSNAVVRVPGNKATRLEVRLNKEAASEVQMETLTLAMDGQYPRFIRASNSEGYVLTVTTKEPLGLLVNEEQRVEASARGRHVYQGDWTILRWDKPYVQSTLVGPLNNPISIRIAQPPGGIVLAGGPSALVRFSGEIPGNCDYRLTIAGQDVRRQAGKPGFHFDAQVPVEPEMQEVAVSAKDETGAMTVLYLRVLRQSGQ